MQIRNRSSERPGRNPEENVRNINEEGQEQPGDVSSDIQDETSRNLY